MTAAGLQAEADRAAAAGDVARARALLEQATGEAPDSAELWIKLAAMRRAGGDAAGALGAVHQALAAQPLDFMALLMRASLLERLGDAGAGEAYGRAIAQRPEGALAPQVAAAVAHGEALYAAHIAANEAKLAAAMAEAEALAAPGEAARIARFRSNALRKTRVYHSEPTHFHFPGLVEREFHDRADFPWIAELEAATDSIAAELDAVMVAERAELVPYIQYAEHEPLRQWRPLNHSRDWTAIHLWQNGRTIEANARHCPRTMKLLERIPQPKIAGCSPNAMFSLLAPETHIPPHVGVANTRLVCHLPLVVPPGCWFRCGAETREWRRGEAFVFDDTIEHEAMNPSQALRVVFIIDVWHPGLSPVEQAAVKAMMEAEGGAAAGL
ncbi:aspartyl/asparaginyl beta-hydroxylase domain-containing protein [Sphingomonas sp. LB-2]|uniref:aspartyl/asparaginyl beta-hydroxylase domain-containing protein n=1 Tax=Sphingomonas caeni TaxID=2984949 RepID=UPI002231830A|nr:aspartyl/asparaginyl beta-hydroxylase domain-containing protein [Sphingomonas caeni]MCW3846272.1 aspartyl/asparaginyl beta-hydroxylase domain-containing protein [Sphingomonas caeni]